MSGPSDTVLGKAKDALELTSRLVQKENFPLPRAVYLGITEFAHSIPHQGPRSMAIKRGLFEGVQSVGYHPDSTPSPREWKSMMQFPFWHRSPQDQAILDWAEQQIAQESQT